MIAKGTLLTVAVGFALGTASGNPILDRVSMLAAEPGLQTGAGGTATTGTAVRTGHSPLSQSVPPAVSTLNPPQSSQRPQNFRGPAQTYPSNNPFGTR
jgi:hypothetical protein